jgi:hypothetical protein
MVSGMQGQNLAFRFERHADLRALLGDVCFRSEAEGPKSTMSLL